MIVTSSGCLCWLQGEEYVNSKTLTDVTFHVEGRPFYAHRIALLASSEAFRAMFGQVGPGEPWDQKHWLFALNTGLLGRGCA